MDEFSRVLQNLMNNVPETEPDTPAPDMEPQPEDVPAFAPMEGGGDAPPGGLQEMLGSLLPGGGGDLSGLMGALGGGMPDNSRLQLLLALKPHLRPGRCDRIDRLCRMLQTAYGIRGALAMLQQLT